MQCTLFIIFCDLLFFRDPNLCQSKGSGRFRWIGSTPICHRQVAPLAHPNPEPATNQQRRPSRSASHEGRTPRMSPTKRPPEDINHWNTSVAATAKESATVESEVYNRRVRGHPSGLQKYPGSLAPCCCQPFQQVFFLTLGG